MGRKNAAGQKIHRIRFPGFFIVNGHAIIIKMLPERRGIDAPVFNLRQRGFHGMNIVNGKQAGDAHSSGHGRNQTGHPVVAMNQIGLNPGNDVVDDFPLKCQGDFDIFQPVIRIDPVLVKKGPVFGQMNPVVGHLVPDGLELLGQERRHLSVKIAR